MKPISLLQSTYFKSHSTKLYPHTQAEDAHDMYNSADIFLEKPKQNNKKIFINTAIFMAVGVFFSTNAIARNLTCPTGYVAADLSPSDYQQLSAGDGGTININGINNAIAALGLQLTIDMTQFGSQQRYISSYTSNGKTGFTIAQNLDNHSEVNTVTFDFNKPVNKLSFTLYDIDYRLGSWRDKITVKGKNGNTPVPLQFSNSGNKMATNNATGIVESDGPSFWAWEAGIECLTPNAPYNILGKNDDFTEKCAATVTFEDPITEFSLVYDNTINSSPSGQNIEMQFNKFCVEEPTLKIEKDDGVTEVTKDSVTSYVIKVKNQSNSSITNATLSDPSVSGLIKQSGIQCDTSISNNACVTAPTITQLENGFSLPTLAQGQTYAITVPTQVTANVGSSITNTATVQHNAKTISAEDTNTVKTNFVPPSPSTPKSCPANHQMYYIGDNAPSAVTTSNKQRYNWINGTTEKTYTFIGSNGNKTKMKLAFPLLIDADDNQPYPYGYQKVPFYYTNFDITTGAINIAHHSLGKKTNHKLQVSINKPVSQFGFVIQDLDSTGNTNGGTSGTVQYIEQVDVSESAGKLLNYDSYYHEINSTQDIVTARGKRNCKRDGVGSGCPIDAMWGYKPTNQPFELKHNNAKIGNGSVQHVIGYSDFYFCLAPPKIIINKVLNGNRIASEQFNIKITDNNAFSEGFTTEGNGNSITLGKNTSGTLELQPNQTYTITEFVVNGGSNASNADYNTTYKCSNSAEDSSAQIPQNGTGKSFSISNLSYGDEIVCTITNTPEVKKDYTFSGIIFNDNGGHAVTFAKYANINNNPSRDKNLPAEYFNGQFEESIEHGIYYENLATKLTDCNGTEIAGQKVFIADQDGRMIQTEDHSNTISNNAIKKGEYKITVPAESLENIDKVCIKEIEPSDWSNPQFVYNADIYPVDTSPNEIKNIALVAGQREYTDNNFGEVKQNNAALILTKRQYINTSCSSDLTNHPTDDSASPKSAYTTQPANDIEPNQCIAYQFEVYNRGHIDLGDVSIVDALQKAGVENSQITLVYDTNVAPQTDQQTSISISASETDTQGRQLIKTQPFNLPASTGKQIYFNTIFKNSAAGN